MKALLNTTLLGLMLTVQTASAQTAETLQPEAEKPRLNLNLPRLALRAAPTQTLAWPERTRTDQRQRLPYGSGYESRQEGRSGSGQRSPVMGGRDAGRSR